MFLISEILLNEEFKTFYSKELKKTDTLERILLAGHPDILLEILKDDFYSFNKNFIFYHVLRYFGSVHNIQGLFTTHQNNTSIEEIK
jgi:hypothetical protein